MNTRWTGMHESKSRSVEKIHKEAKSEKEMPRLTNPRKVFRRYQGEKGCPGRIRGQRFCRQEEDEDDINFQKVGSLCLHLTALWPHLTLSASSHNSLLRWPRLPLIALAILRLYFFCSSIKRSSEHFCLCCWPPPWWHTSTKQPGLRPPRTR